MNVISDAWSNAAVLELERPPSDIRFAPLENSTGPSATLRAGVAPVEIKNPPLYRQLVRYIPIAVIKCRLSEISTVEWDSCFGSTMDANGVLPPSRHIQDIAGFRVPNNPQGTGMILRKLAEETYPVLYAYENPGVAGPELLKTTLDTLQLSPNKGELLSPAQAEACGAWEIRLGDVRYQFIKSKCYPFHEIADDVSFKNEQGGRRIGGTALPLYDAPPVLCLDI